MSYTPIRDFSGEATTPPVPQRSTLSSMLRSPSGAELREILDVIMPVYANHDEAGFLWAFQIALEQRGLAFSYAAKEAAQVARHKAHVQAGWLQAIGR